MQILELRAQSFGKLTAIEIRPDGNMVPITGSNAAGKTTILKAIWALVLGRSAAPPVAIQEGAEEAMLYGDFGAYKVTRTIKKGEDGLERWDLKVVDASGKRITTKPQAVIDGWLGALTLDPLEFARMAPDKQFDKLKALVKGFDFEAEAKARKTAFEQRTDVNRLATREQAAADAVALPPGPEPKPVDVTALLDELQQGDIALREQRRRDDARAAFDRIRDEAENLRARAASLEKQANEQEAALEALPAVALKDMDAIRAQIGHADQIKGVITMHQNRCGHLEAAAKFKAEAAKLTAEIEASDDRRDTAIAAAKFPVEGLSLGDAEVTLNGLPFEQASTMERIMTGAALGMAMNPELKVMTIDEASELDSRALAALTKLAQKHDFSVWYTKVDESGETGFYIVDGAVAEVGAMT